MTPSKAKKFFPDKPEDRDSLYFFAQSFQARLLHDLPTDKKDFNKSRQFLSIRAKSLIKDLAKINYELAQMVVSDEDEKILPRWFVVEIVRDLPRLVRND